MLAGCTESGTSESTGTGGAWTKSLCAGMKPGRSIKDLFWFSKTLCEADGQQEPVYQEYGDVTEVFRDSPITGHEGAR